MGNCSEKQDWALVDGVWGGGVGFGGSVDCGRFTAFHFRKRVAGGSGVSCACGQRGGNQRGEGCLKAIFWIWWSERLPGICSGLSFVAGKIGVKRIG